MTTQPTEAVANDANDPVDATAPKTFADIANSILEEQQEEENPEGAEEQSDELTEDDIPEEEEADDLPPIEPPVSWDADAKAKFAELPRELQETVTKREAEREKFVQSKSQEAAQARQTVAQQAQAELAQYDAQVAQHLQQLSAQLDLQAPDPQLLRINPEAFYAQEADYRAKVAQRDHLQQQAQTFAQQAQQRATQIEQATLAEQHRIIVESFPEYADPTTGPELQRKLSAAAKRIGYSDELISQARASDIIAMREVASALEKADKYDALMKNKMAGVRAAKGLPRVATPGVPQGSNQIKANNHATAIANLKQTGSVDAAAAAFKSIL